jgi:Protein of unknown function (DUF998)
MRRPRRSCVTTFTVAGHTQDGYEPRRHSVSTLALGPGGVVQRANFVVAGLLYLAGSGGLVRTGRYGLPARLGPQAPSFATLDPDL